MANASIFCTDKTGTLTQNVMSVVASLIGIHAKFTPNLKENKPRTNTPDQEQDQPQEQDMTKAAERPQVYRKYADGFSIEQDDINTITILSPPLRRPFNQSIMINFITFVGSKTETTLLRFAKDLSWDN